MAYGPVGIPSSCLLQGIDQGAEARLLVCYIATRSESETVDILEGLGEVIDPLHC